MSPRAGRKRFVSRPFFMSAGRAVPRKTRISGIRGRHAVSGCFFPFCRTVGISDTDRRLNHGYLQFRALCRSHRRRRDRARDAASGQRTGRGRERPPPPGRGRDRQGGLRLCRARALSVPLRGAPAGEAGAGGLLPQRLVPPGLRPERGARPADPPGGGAAP